MEQFSLDKWLQDKSRKVVTRDGRSVRIVCCDLKCNTSIIAAILWNQEREDCYCYNTAGRCANNIGEIDLFFADEEEELTEFEKAIRNILVRYISNIDDFPETIIREAKSLLDLARKEIEKNNVIIDKDKYLKICDQYYNNGKETALKDLPKWKKATENKEFDRHIILFEDEERIVLTTEIYKGEYYIEADDLKTLPKEE